MLSYQTNTAYEQHVFQRLRYGPSAFIRKGLPVREDTHHGPSAYDIGWPFPFLAAFISPVLPQGNQSLLGGQRTSMQPRHTKCWESPIAPASFILIILVYKLCRKVITCSYIRRYYAEFHHEIQYRKVINCFCSVF